MMKAIKTGQYKASTVEVEGNKVVILAYLRKEALRMRNESRETMNKNVQNVHSILGNSKHTSALVNLASFNIKKLGINQLLPLMNAHGIFTYKVK